MIFRSDQTAGTCECFYSSGECSGSACCCRTSTAHHSTAPLGVRFRNLRNASRALRFPFSSAGHDASRGALKSARVHLHSWETPRRIRPSNDQGHDEPPSRKKVSHLGRLPNCHRASSGVHARTGSVVQASPVAVVPARRLCNRGVSALLKVIRVSVMHEAQYSRTGDARSVQ